MKKKLKPDEDVDAGALLARLRAAFRGNDPADWGHAAETLREVDEAVRRIIDAGDMQALPGAMLALGFMISLRDTRTGVRAAGQRTGGIREQPKKIADEAQVIAFYDARVLEKGKRGAQQVTAQKFGVHPSRVSRVVKRHKGKS